MVAGRLAGDAAQVESQPGKFIELAEDDRTDRSPSGGGEAPPPRGGGGEGRSLTVRRNLNGQRPCGWA